MGLPYLLLDQIPSVARPHDLYPRLYSICYGSHGKSRSLRIFFSWQSSVSTLIPWDIAFSFSPPSFICILSLLCCIFIFNSHVPYSSPPLSLISLRCQLLKPTRSSLLVPPSRQPLLAHLSPRFPQSPPTPFSPVTRSPLKERVVPLRHPPFWTLVSCLKSLCPRYRTLFIVHFVIALALISHFFHPILQSLLISSTHTEQRLVFNRYRTLYRYLYPRFTSPCRFTVFSKSVLTGGGHSALPPSIFPRVLVFVGLATSPIFLFILAFNFIAKIFILLGLSSGAASSPTHNTPAGRIYPSSSSSLLFSLSDVVFCTLFFFCCSGKKGRRRIKRKEEMQIF